MSVKTNFNRPLSKLAYANKCEEPTERRSAVYSDVDEHLSTGETKHLAAEVEFRKRSNDTIYAPASAYLQKAGIIVVRVSGSKVKSALKALGYNQTLKPRYATLANIFHPVTKVLIDSCILVYYEAPHSFTGDDVLEFNIHGGKST